VAGIIMRDNIPTLQDIFDMLVHKMAHADVEMRQLPTAMEWNGMLYSYRRALAIAAVSGNTG